MASAWCKLHPKNLLIFFTNFPLSKQSYLFPSLLRDFMPLSRLGYTSHCFLSISYMCSPVSRTGLSRWSCLPYIITTPPRLLRNYRCPTSRLLVPLPPRSHNHHQRRHGNLPNHLSRLWSPQTSIRNPTLIPRWRGARGGRRRRSSSLRARISLIIRRLGIQQIFSMKSFDP